MPFLPLHVPSINLHSHNTMWERCHPRARLKNNMACSCYRQSLCLCISLNYRTAQSQQTWSFNTDKTEILHSETVHRPSISKIYFPAIDFNASFYSKNFQVKFSTLYSWNSECLCIIHNPFIIRIHAIILQQMHTSTLKLVCVCVYIYIYIHMYSEILQV